MLVVNVPVDCVPLVAFVPDHPPEAEQEVAFVVDQVSVALPPLAMVVGLKDSETAGAGEEADETVTITVCEAWPPFPVHVSV